jgi:hypothetical protein
MLSSARFFLNYIWQAGRGVRIGSYSDGYIVLARKLLGKTVSGRPRYR